MAGIGSSERPDWSLAVVSGAGGLAAAAARRLSQRCRVLLFDLDAHRAETLAGALRSEGADAQAIGCDITSPQDVARLSARVEKLGGLQVLAHVVGLSPSLGDFRTLMQVNLAGAAAVAEALLPLARPGAAAIFVASLAGHGRRPSEAVEAILRLPRDPKLVERLAAELGEAGATPQAAYVLSKYGLIDYCRRQAPAWGARRARILSLSPGLIATPQGAREFEHSAGKVKLYERIPLEREGTMLEIADAIEFLASDKASYISGTDILVDGGLSGALVDG